MSDMQTLYLMVPLAPLAGAILAGLFGKVIGRAGSHVVTILGVAIAFVLSIVIYQDVQAGNTFNGTVTPGPTAATSTSRSASSSTSSR